MSQTKSTQRNEHNYKTLDTETARLKWITLYPAIQRVGDKNIPKELDSIKMNTENFPKSQIQKEQERNDTINPIQENKN